MTVVVVAVVIRPVHKGSKLVLVLCIVVLCRCWCVVFRQWSRVFQKKNEVKCDFEPRPPQHTTNISAMKND